MVTNLPASAGDVSSLVREDPTCHRATQPGHRYDWGHEPRAYALPQEKPPQWEAQPLQLESNPHFLQLAKACVQQWRPSTAKKKLTNEINKKKSRNSVILYLCISYWTKYKYAVCTNLIFNSQEQGF